MTHILNTVSEVTGVSVEDMLGKRRYREMADARILCQYIMRHEFRYMLKEICAVFNCHHTTVVKNVVFFHGTMEYLPKLQGHYAAAMSILNPETIAA